MSDNCTSDSDRPLRCHFWTDKDDALGLESEYQSEDSIVRCSAEATGVVRLRSGGAKGFAGNVLWQAGHLPVCQTHLEHLTEDADIEWEALVVLGTPGEVRENARPNYDFVPSVNEKHSRYVDTVSDRSGGGA